jgi:predicted nucleic acid-binding protein
MFTAVDSNVLIDLLGEESRFTPTSIQALDDARLRGALVICPAVAAEISSHFASHRAMAEALAAMGITLEELSLAALHLAGATFVRYRQRSQKPKDRMLVDFLVGAHALHGADRLLTRDRGYYRTYFPKLQLVEPENH